MDLGILRTSKCRPSEVDKTRHFQYQEIWLNLSRTEEILPNLEDEMDVCSLVTPGDEQCPISAGDNKKINIVFPIPNNIPSMRVTVEFSAEIYNADNSLITHVKGPVTLNK